MNGLHAAAVGRPGRDGELKYLPNGTALLSFPLAVEDQKQREGDDTQWIRVSVWGERAEGLDAQVKKGEFWYFEGRANVRTWTNQSGETKADLELSAWRCEPLFQIGRARQEPTPASPSFGAIRPGRPMPERVAVGAGAGASRRGDRSGPADDPEMDLPF